jgi:serine/threonine protein kinase/tetratricopeptide (TPR) repeat protein
MREPMKCLDDNAVVAYVERLLPAATLEQIAQHLDHCEACLTITCAAARSAQAASATAVAVDGGDDLQRGDRVGRYQLEQLIGRGAMGAVYVAQDPQLDRKVALKIVRSARFAEPAVRARLSREARAMAKVKHPHVVTVYDAGELDDGVFIAMELIEDSTLTEWLSAQPRRWQEIIAMYVAIGRGLAAAHAAGIVHRDFKPENVLVDRQGRAAVTDFGLAVALELPLELQATAPASAASSVASSAAPSAAPSPASSVAPPGAPEAGQPGPAQDLAFSDTHDPTAGRVTPSSQRPWSEGAERLTRTGVLLGTPRYMSPEQFRGDEVGAAADQFSFAVALFEALYRTPPFAGATLAELREAVTLGAPRARPASSPVPAAVHQVLARALHPSAGARFTSMEALLQALQTASHARRRRAVAISLAGGVALAAASLFLLRIPSCSESPSVARLAPSLSVASQDARHGESVPVAARALIVIERFANKTGDEHLDDTLDLVIASTLARSTRIDVLAGIELVDLTARLGGSASAVAGLLAKLRERDGRQPIALHGLVEAQGGGYQLSVTAEAPMPAPFAATKHVTKREDLIAAAAELADQLRAALADPAAAPAKVPISSSVEALHLYMQGQTRAVGGDHTAAVEHFKASLAIDPELVEARAALGLTLYNLGDRSAAIPELERAVREVDRMPERQHLALLADYYGTIGRFPEAIAAYEQLLARWPGDARAEISIAATAIDAGSWPLALDLAKRAFRDHANLGVVRANLVLAQLANGLFAEAAHTSDAMLAELARPTDFGFVFAAMSHALAGDGAAAAAAYDRLATYLPELADEGRADLAMYEGRLDDAAALLRKYTEPAMARKAPLEARAEVLALSQLALRRGDRKAARAVTLVMDSGDPRNDYLASSLAIEAGATIDAGALIRAWSAQPLAEWRLGARLLAGDLERAHGRPREAIAAYQEADLIAPSWITHERLGRAYLAAADWPAADRELTWCVQHRGEGAVFVTPMLSALPQVLLGLARAKDRGHAPLEEVLAAYRAVIALSPQPQRDPFTEEARQRVATLSP